MTKRITVPNGYTAVLVPNDLKAIIVCEAQHYRLGGQHDEIVDGWTLATSVPMYWDTLSQKWTEQ